jgi:serine phosphatase RsbU (regulator of sigma subunit)
MRECIANEICGKYCFMNDVVYSITKRIRPELEKYIGQQRMSATADVLTLLYTLPLVIVGLIWLAKVSDWESIRQKWSIYLLMGAILYIFNRLRFFIITEIRSGEYANSVGAMDGLAIWASVLILGPTAIWLKVIWDCLTFTTSIDRTKTAQSYWSRGRMFTADLSSDVLPMLIALAVYRMVGGIIPLQDISINSIAPAFLAIIIHYIGTLIIYSGYISYVIWSLKNVLHTPIQPAFSFFTLALGLPSLANPFGILVAGIFVSEGIWSFTFIILGLIIVAILGRRLSLAAEYSRQQYSQIGQLEKLGRAILDAPPDGSNLPAVFKEHVPSMFASQAIYIWTESHGILVQEPPSALFNHELAWRWMKEKGEAYYSMPGKRPPWNPEWSFSGPIIYCPVNDVETDQPIGEVFIELQTLNIPWNTRSIHRLLPAVQSLAAQVASAIHQSQVYARNLAMQKTLQELSLAHTIQASFLPESIPQISGWQLTATLEPARQIAGDFYDFIKLPEEKWGILIADVADKGLGSALYMALSNTLIRTFASEYHRNPAKVLKTANQQILRNARANLFVTVFFGVLDPTSGMLCYANAGHNPPFLIGVDGIKTLNNTGMPLGIDEDNEWLQEELLITPGEILFLYTDGLMDAQNVAGEFIDRRAILNTVQSHLGKSVHELQQSLLNKVHRFVDEAPRFDDLTLVILGREKEEK